jgi:4-hydroxy-tetrahydrodipicolinate reductase
MKIALIGYGRMNRAIETIAVERGHTISQRVTSTPALAAADLHDIDVAIEFSTAQSAVANLIVLAERGVRTIAGATGFPTDALTAIRPIVEQSRGALLWSPNFSIGVHLFWQLVEHATRLANAFPEYDVFVHETHHRMKVDAPSGTAIQTAEMVVAASNHKRTVVTGNAARPLESSELHVSSSRGGSSPGEHTVTFDSLDDTIRLQHTARSRGAFARGAVQGAEWLADKVGYFTMDDFIAAQLT